MKRRRGVTLVELLVYFALWTTLAVGTMHVLGQARMMRSNSRDRAQMLLAAQSELDRVRMPGAVVEEGVHEWMPEAAPEGCEGTREVTSFDEHHWQVAVRVHRPSLEGKPSVELVTLVRKSPR